jgi:hypothetical protein
LRGPTRFRGRRSHCHAPRVGRGTIVGRGRRGLPLHGASGDAAAIETKIALVPTSSINVPLGEDKRPERKI